MKLNLFIIQKRYLYLLILLLSTVLNYYTDFGFLLKHEIFIIIWLLFYTIIFPISSMFYVFEKYKSTRKLFSISLYVIISYLLSALLSGFNFFNFKTYVVEGDGATKFVVQVIFVVCFLSSMGSLIVFQIINKKVNKGCRI